MKFETWMNITLASLLAYNLGKRQAKPVPTPIERDKEEEKLTFIFPALGDVGVIMHHLSDILKSSGRVTMADLLEECDENWLTLRMKLASFYTQEFHHDLGWSIINYSPTITPYMDISGNITGYILKFPKPQKF